jgi:hypothetical protein
MTLNTLTIPGCKIALSLFAAGVVLVTSTSCESWENTSSTKKSTIIGGAGGAAIGAAVAKDNRAAGALLGGALGAGGGYLFGKNRSNH